MKTSAIEVKKHDDGSYEIIIDGRQEGSYADADAMALHFGLCIVRMQDLSSAIEKCHRYFKYQGSLIGLQSLCSEAKSAVRKMMK